jgi:hypothetical protein
MTLPFLTEASTRVHRVFILLLATLLPTTSPALDVLFIGGAATPAQGADGGVMAYLQTRYGVPNVTYMQASATTSGSVSGFDVLVISSTPSSGDLRGKFHNSTVGIINWEEAIMDSVSGEFGLSSVVMTKSTTTTQITITGAHPITNGLTGTINFVSGGETLNTTGLFAGLTTLATAANGADAGNPAIFLANTGDALVASTGASPAKGRRVMFPITDATFNSLTAAGLQLFGQAVDWASGGAPVSAPTIINTSATGITGNTATIGGQVTNTGGENPNVILYWGDNDGGTTPASWDNAVAQGLQNSTFTQDLGGLAPGTTYFFRSFASNSAGSVWTTPTATFSTTPAASPPTVVNSPAAAISFFAADLNGQVTATGGEAPTVTIYWGTSDGATTPASWQNSAGVGVQSGAFDTSLFGLQHNTAYFFRASATNSGGTAWAPSSASFTTLQVMPPTLVNTAATGITAVSAQVGADVTFTGGESPVVTLYYGKTDGGTTPGTWQNSLNLDAKSGPFTTPLTGLDPSSTYFYSHRGVNLGGTVWATPSISFTTPQISTLRINEFMAANSATAVPNAVAGRFDDWIEIHNTSGAEVNVGGWFLTDTAAIPNKWTFPPGTLVPADGFLVVFASGDNMPDANGNLHTNFGLSAGGEYLALVRPDLSVASEFGPAGTNFPPQDTDLSYGVSPLDLDSVYFATPTPGAPNSASGIAVADTKFSHSRGYYTTSFNLAITTATPGASIRYTLDGDAPTPTTGTLYTGLLPINKTTVVRAIAYRSGYVPTNVDTQTYLFPSDIATQQVNAAGFPTFPVFTGGNNGDYDVSTAVSQSPQYSQRFRDGLRLLPVVSVNGNKNAIFGPGSGIYSDTQNRNAETAISAEYFVPSPALDGVNVKSGFQIDCGLKLQGGASRNTGSAIKHSFSLRFRAQYGDGNLRYPLFPGSPVTKFDSLQLRSMYNNSWIHSAADQRARATLMRDQWARSTLLAMGNPDGGRGEFVHLYINGLYWGVYNFHERLENDHYAAYHGYDDATVLGYNPGTPTPAETTSFNAMKNVVTNPGSTWSQIQAVLDVDSYIDFFIVQHFGHNDDLKTNDNWRCAGGGTAGAPYRFYCWDTERTMENPTNTGNLAVHQDGAGLIDSLDNYREFRVRFADRAFKHLFNGGPLANANNRARFQALANGLDIPIVCESAKWGDDRGGGGFGGIYSRDENWMRAVYGTPTGPGTNPTSGVLGSWFPATGQNRSDIIVSAWRTKAWPGSSDTYLGSIIAPAFTVNGSNQHGGEVPAGGSLSATAPSGSIYYTTDGSDPRLEGGGLSPGAILLAGNMTLPSSGLVRMRARVGAGDSWSALNEATYYLEPRAGAGDLRITEILYNAPAATAVEQVAGAALPVPRVLSGGDFEFIEIQNVSSSPVNLDGVTFTKGFLFTFPLMALPAGGRATLVADAEAFPLRHRAAPPVAGQFAGSLDNNGETVAFNAWDGTVIQNFSYSDTSPWPTRADGDGSSLEVVSTAGDYANPSNWRSSSEYNGSPGTAGSGPDGRIVINEVLAHSGLPERDSIELFNTTTTPIDVENWFLSDSKANYQKYRLPAHSIPAQGYLTKDETYFNAPGTLAISSFSGTPAAQPTTVATPAPHGLATGSVVTVSGYGGIGAYNGTFEVTVLTPTSFTVPATFLDDQETKGTYTPGQPFALDGIHGESVWLLEADATGKLLRFVDKVDFAASRRSETLGRWPNGAGTGTLVTMTANTLGSTNSGAKVGPVVISEVHYHPVNLPESNFEFIELCNTGPTTEYLDHWRLRGGADFNFNTSHSIAPGGFLVLVAFDPAASPVTAAAFRAAYGIDASIPLLGPFTDGPLGNVSGTVRLQRSDAPPTAEPSFYPQVTEDEIIYANTAPWPPSADGGGPSLQRSAPGGFGLFPSSWSAEPPNPGGKILSFANWSIAVFGPGNPPLSGPNDDFDFDGIPNLAEFALGLNPLVADNSGLPGLTFSGNFATLTFPKNILLQGLTYTVQSSPDLVTWSNLTDTLQSTANYIEIRSASAPVTANPNLYLRMRISL